MRSSWKLPFTFRRFNRLSLRYDRWQRILDEEENVFLRRFSIPRTLDGKFISVYNGDDFIDFFASRSCTGHKLGEFSITKILGAEYRLAFARKKKKKRNKNKKRRK